MIDPEVSREQFERGPDALKRHSRVPHCCQHERFGQAYEGDRRLAAVLAWQRRHNRGPLHRSPTWTWPGVTLRPGGEGCGVDPYRARLPQWVCKAEHRSADPERPWSPPDRLSTYLSVVLGALQQHSTLSPVQEAGHSEARPALAWAIEALREVEVARGVLGSLTPNSDHRLRAIYLAVQTVLPRFARELERPS